MRDKSPLINNKTADAYLQYSNAAEMTTTTSNKENTVARISLLLFFSRMGFPGFIGTGVIWMANRKENSGSIYHKQIHKPTKKQTNKQTNKHIQKKQRNRERN